VVFHPYEADPPTVNLIWAGVDTFLLLEVPAEAQPLGQSIHNFFSNELGKAGPARCLSVLS
jgi:hypothetical protein